MESNNDAIRVAINPEISYASIDNEMVILGAKNQQYYGLNPMGAAIFKLLEHGGLLFDELIAVLIKDYLISLEQCREELKQFIDKMCHNNLLYLESKSIIKDCTIKSSKRRVVEENKQ
jgi:hypothetical protein